MNSLIPCPSCLRHVRASSTACPFCEATLDPEAAPRRPPSARRLGRFAAFTFQSGLVAAAIGCTDDTLVPGTDGPLGSGGASTGGSTASGGAVGTGGAATGGEAAVGGEGGLGAAPGTGGDEPDVSIYSAVPWTGPGRR